MKNIILAFLFSILLVSGVYATNGTIKIIKDAQPNSPQDFNFTTTGGNSLPSSFFLDDDSNGTLPNTRSWSTHFGTYTVSETAYLHWILQSIVCTESGGHNNSTVDVDGRTATIRLEIGETVTCKFTNMFSTAALNTVSGKVMTSLGDGIKGIEV
jgi:hypothetical protein